MNSYGSLHNDAKTILIRMVPCMMMQKHMKISNTQAQLDDGRGGRCSGGGGGEGLGGYGLGASGGGGGDHGSDE